MLRRGGQFMGDMIRQADLLLLALCCAATGFGILMIASATHYMGSARYVIVQAVAAVLGVVLYFMTSLLDVNELMKKGWKWTFLFNIVLILLLKTPLGFESNGNLAWLHFPGFPVNIQPAEIVKITFVLLLAKQLAWLKEERNDLRSITAVGSLGAHLMIIFGLYYAISSDMGSGLVLIFIFVCMAFVAGVAARWFIGGFACAGIGFYILWNEDVIKDYMKKRFIVLFDHSYDAMDTGWQQTRSLMTLGGGKVTGMGLFHGTQTQSEYVWSLPFRYTDFIFSVIGEELGIIGCVLVLLLLLAIILRCLVTAKRAKTSMEAYVCVGVAAMLTFQVIANVGMCLFVMPVIGLTLPFISYGGSSIVTLFIAVGLVSGIHKRSRPEWLR